MTKIPDKLDTLERISRSATEWIGTPLSILVHTLLFIGIFALSFFEVAINDILLILTTVVSLEAIYLGIFIQMTVNRNTESLEEVEEDINELQEDVEDIQEDVEELEEDFDEIQEEDDQEESQTKKSLESIEVELKKLLTEIEDLKNKNLHT